MRRNSDKKDAITDAETMTPEQKVQAFQSIVQQASQELGVSIVPIVQDNMGAVINQWLSEKGASIQLAFVPTEGTVRTDEHPE